MGPHKVAYCELYDHGDGTFTLNVKPQEAGRHTLTVKYGGYFHNFICFFLAGGRMQGPSFKPSNALLNLSFNADLTL